MEVFQAIQERRAIKAYDPAHEMSESEVEKLLEAARLSPTAFNIQNWRFLIVRDAEQRKKIRAAGWDQAQMTDASLLIVLCADTKSWDKEPRRYFRNAPQDLQDMMATATHDYYAGKEQTQRDEAMRSVGIAAQTIMLAATAMGYQSCPMDGFDFNAVGTIINLPQDYIIGMMVAIGKGTLPPKPRSGPIDASEAIFYDTF